MRKIAEFHAHPTLHPYANYISEEKEVISVWDSVAPEKKDRPKKYPSYLQSDFSTLIKGNVKLISASLYPLEQGWFSVIGMKSFIIDLIAKGVVKLPVEFINIVQNSNYNYFETLVGEYNYLVNHKKAHDVVVEGQIRKSSFSISKNGDQVKSTIDKANTVTVVFSIEGAHSFIKGNAKTIENGISWDDIKNNVKTVKTWDYPPLYISMSHHFYNGMVGHARSIPKLGAALLNQKKGMNAGFSEVGGMAVDCLLGINEFTGEEGRRVLIDIKHLAVTARKEYYEKLDAYQASNPSDIIPIVASHIGYSGVASIDDFEKDTDKLYRKSDVFNPWSINLADDELVRINKSKGIVGINLDQRVLTGNKRLKYYKNTLTKRFLKCGILKRSEKIRDFWADQIVLNILGIVKAMVNGAQNEEQKNNAWGCISIGSDFDGMIDSVDAYINSYELQDLATDLDRAFGRNKDFSSLQFSFSKQEIIEKILFKNVYDFIVKHYK